MIGIMHSVMLMEDEVKKYTIKGLYFYTYIYNAKEKKKVKQYLPGWFLPDGYSFDSQGCPYLSFDPYCFVICNEKGETVWYPYYYVYRETSSGTKTYYKRYNSLSNAKFAKGKYYIHQFAPQYSGLANLTEDIEFTVDGNNPAIDLNTEIYIDSCGYIQVIPEQKTESSVPKDDSWKDIGLPFDTGISYSGEDVNPLLVFENSGTTPMIKYEYLDLTTGELLKTMEGFIGSVPSFSYQRLDNRYYLCYMGHERGNYFVKCCWADSGYVIAMINIPFELDGHCFPGQFYYFYVNISAGWDFSVQDITSVTYGQLESAARKYLKSHDPADLEIEIGGGKRNIFSSYPNYTTGRPGDDFLLYNATDERMASGDKQKNIWLCGNEINSKLQETGFYVDGLSTYQPYSYTLAANRITSYKNFKGADENTKYSSAGGYANYYVTAGGYYIQSENYSFYAKQNNDEFPEAQEIDDYLKSIAEPY